MEFLHLSAKQYRDMLAGKSVSKDNKYHAKKTEYDGVMFDSKWECQKWQELQLKQKLGFIKNLQMQVSFVLQEGFINNQGKKIRPIVYVADFMFFDCKTNQTIVMDTKSPATRTKVYMIKKRLFEYKYPQYIFLEVCKK